jgi:CDP-diglyceride synthetase
MSAKVMKCNHCGHYPSWDGYDCNNCGRKVVEMDEGLKALMLLGFIVFAIILFGTTALGIYNIVQLKKGEKYYWQSLAGLAASLLIITIAALTLNEKGSGNEYIFYIISAVNTLGFFINLALVIIYRRNNLIPKKQEELL